LLSQRQVEILKTIVDEFIISAEPVGSKTLMEKYHLPYSSATIRNEMSDLESLGYLEKTHTSSGRIPSTEGYRYYVENLLEGKIDQQLSLAIKDIFSDRQQNVEDVIKRSCDILSQMTNLTSMVLGPEAMDQTLEHINLFPLDNNQAVAVFITNQGHTENRLFTFNEAISVDELARCCVILNDRLSGTRLNEIIEKLQLIKPLLAKSINQYEMVFKAFFDAFLKFAESNYYMSGANNLINQPEFADVNKLKQLLIMFENSGIWRDIKHTQGALTLERNPHSSLVWVDNMAVISSTLNLTQEQTGQLMVIGPSRMQYARVLALMEFLSDAIEKIYGNED